MNEMTTETIPIQVPEALYRRLERLAALTHRPVESLVVQTLSSSIPPLPDDLPPPTRDAQTSLDRLTQDADLRTLRKAYAAVLLKWRGHRLPTLADLEAQP